MAIIYLRSTNGTNNADDGSTWALAKTTLTAALTAAGAGGTVYVSQDHAESQASSLELNSPGTAADLVKIICVSDATAPPTTLATTATVTTTGASTISFSGFGYCYGVTFNAGTGSSSANITFSSVSSWHWCLEYCALFINVTSTASRIMIGDRTYNADDNRLILKNCSLKFGHVSQGIQPSCMFDMIGGSILSSGSKPTVLLKSVGASRGVVTLSGVDISALTAITSSSLVLANIGAQTIYNFSNCLLGSGVSILYGSIAGHGGISVYLDNCDSGDPSSGPRSEAYTYQGSVKTDTAKYRTGGASDGTSYSLMMTSNTTGVSFISPLVTRPIPKVIDTVGSEITVTAHIAMEEGATPLTESQCWMEVEYMGTSGSTLTSFLTDNNSTVISESSTDQEISTETWNGFTGTPVKQKLSVAFTPQEKGFYMVRIYLARVSAETTAPPVYVCPKLAVS